MSLANNKLDEFDGSNGDTLEKQSRKDLVGYIQHLRNKVEELESHQLISQRVKHLEKNIFSSRQYYQRRERIEIHNIPEIVADDKLEDTCLNILSDIGCGVIQKCQVLTCHHLRNRNNSIIRFITRKHADSALHNRGK